jgi:hypothetical protein
MADDLLNPPQSLADRVRKHANVPDTCQLDTLLLIAIMATDADVCAGCNTDRAVCKGRPRRDPC